MCEFSVSPLKIGWSNSYSIYNTSANFTTRGTDEEARNHMVKKEQRMGH